MGLTKKHFTSSDYAQSVFQIDIEKLVNSGLRSIIIDLDSTLVGWGIRTPAREIQEWSKKTNDPGLTVIIAPNNSEKRVSGFSEDLDVDFIFKTKEPMGRIFRKVIQHVDIKPEEIVVIDDRMPTDVLGGNNNGLYTIMVVPVKKTDEFLIRLNRTIEC